MPTYRALLIGNGTTLSQTRLAELARQAHVLLAVDGGADHALRAGLTPDVVIGDLDSVSPRTKKLLAPRLVHVATQENTDLEKALLWALQHHVTHVTLAGFVGNRWDFSIGNLLTLSAYARKLDVRVAGEDWMIYPLVKSAQLACAKNKRLSLIPLQPCRHVTLTGCKYPLHDENLPPGTTRTLSNQTTSTRVRLTFTRGKLLVYLEGN